MTQQTGVNATVMIGYETVAFGTVATAGFVLPVNSCGVVGTKARNSPATLTGSRSPVAPFTGRQDVGGTIVVPADSDAMPYWLHAMFDDAGTTGSDPYVHEYKIGATMPAFSLEKAFTDIDTNAYERFVGCRVASFSMTLGGDGELVCTMDVLGAQMSEETSAFDGSPTTVTLDRVNTYDAALTEGGAGLSNATEVNVNVDFGLDGEQFVIGGAGVRGDIPVGIVAVTGNLQTLFEDVALLNKAINDTESSLVITITNSANSVLTFEIQELLYSVNGVPIEGPQGLLVNLDFVGYYTDGSEASAIVARATNNVVSYSL